MVTRKMAALVFGNSAYPDGDELKNPVNDATDLGSKLKAYGFDVISAHCGKGGGLTRLAAAFESRRRFFTWSRRLE